MRVGESLPPRDVAAAPVVPEPTLDDLENVLRDAFVDDEVTPPLTPGSLPSLDELVKAEYDDEEDEIPVFTELMPVVRVSPPVVRVSPPRSWSRTDTGGLRQSPPRTIVFDL